MTAKFLTKREVMSQREKSRKNAEIAVEKSESDSSDDWVIRYWNNIDTDKERERFSNGVYSAHVKRLLIEGKIHNAG